MRSARLSAEVAEGADEARVRIEYRVAPRDGTGAPLRVRSLGFGPARVEGFRLTWPAVGDGVVAVPLPVESGTLRAAALPSPAAPPGDGEMALSLEYDVAGAVERDGPEVRLRLPVLVLDLPPPPGGARIFQASVRLPDAWSVAGGFPTGLAPGGEGTWQVDLPVVPALVSLRGRSDGGWRPGVSRVLDALALLLLAGFAVVGWRHLRRVARP